MFYLSVDRKGLDDQEHPYKIWEEKIFQGKKIASVKALGGRADGMFQDHKGGKGGCSTEVESSKMEV